MNALDKYLDTSEGMTLLATQQDDQTVTCVGAEWFKYNGVTARNVYINGNSWIGLGANAEHMKICRRDGKCHFLYRQELELLGIRCVKYRWDGYSVYNSTSATYKLTWELFVFDNNDIFLNCINVPTNGTHEFNLLGGVGTFSPAPGKFISMYCQDKENGKVFNLVEELYVNTHIDIRYLLKDDNWLYKVSEDNTSLIQLEETELSSSLFISHGSNEIPNGDLMKELTSPKLLQWCAETSVNIKLKASVKALPNAQTIIQDYFSFYNDESIKGLSNFKVYGEINEQAIVKFALSFDSVTYYTFNNSWEPLDIANSTLFLEIGMSKEALEGLTQTQLEELFYAQEIYKFKVAVIIDYSNINAIANIEQVRLNFIN